MAQVRRVIDLALLAIVVVEVRIVGHFFHHGGHPGPEGLAQLARSGLGVFQRVVQQRRGDDFRVGDSPFHRQRAGQRQRMVDVARGMQILAALLAMAVGGKGGGLQNEGQALGRQREGRLAGFRFHGEIRGALGKACQAA